MRSVGLGLIGFGGFGRFTAGVFAQMPEVRIVSLAEADPTRREEAKRSLGVPVVPSAEALLAIPEVEAVVISTPPATHAPLIEAAARAGKHIFCEKPLAISLAEADEAIAIAREKDVRLTVDFVLRQNPLNQRVGDLLRSGVLGPLLHMSLENCATDEALKPGHWFWDASVSGGIWVEHGVHFFDLFTKLSGQTPESVQASSTARPDGCLDRVWALVTYSHGLKAEYYHGFTQPARFEETTLRLVTVRSSITLRGWIQTEATIDALLDDPGLEKARSILGMEPVTLERYTGEEQEGWASGAPYHVTCRARFDLRLPQGKQAVYRESVAAGMRDFIQAIMDSHHALSVTAQDGHDALAVALAAAHAAESGALVRLLEPAEG